MANLTQTNNSKSSNSLLIIIFSVLLLIIASLTISIILINQPKEENDELYIEPASPEDAADFAEEIKTKYEEDGDYLIEDAKNDFSNAIDSLDGKNKVKLTIEYAIFCYDDIDDHQSALNILESVKDIPMDEETEIDYYYAYTDLYDDMGDFTTAANYQNIIAKKYPDIVDPYDVSKQKELEYEEE